MLNVVLKYYKELFEFDLIQNILHQIHKFFLINNNIWLNLNVLMKTKSTEAIQGWYISYI